MKSAALVLLFLISTAVHAAVTLDEAFRSALSQNEVVGQARERVFQADEQYTQARGAIFPTLSFQASHLIQPQPENLIAREIFPEEQTTTNLNLRQPLFRGFREFAGVRQRRRVLTAEQQNRVNTLLELYQSVATSYLNVLSFEQDLKNLAEQRKIYNERIRELQARIRRGESNSSEALTAQSTEAALEAEMRIVETNLASARENFKLVTTLPADTKLMDRSVEGRKSLPTLKPLEDYLSRIENRPDVKAARDRLEAAQEEIRVARGAHWPTLDLQGNYYFQRPPGFLNEIRWDVQLNLSFPLYEGGTVLSQTREAASRNRDRELELSRLRRQAEADVKSLYESLKNRSDQLAALERSSELAEKNYQVLQRDFRRGLSRSIDVQLALTEFRIARRSYDQARFAAQLDWIRLQLASAAFPEALEKELAP
ncbi:MAG: TolC family protein [Bdellovibrionales bacterium]